MECIKATVTMNILQFAIFVGYEGTEDILHMAVETIKNRELSEFRRQISTETPDMGASLVKKTCDSCGRQPSN